MTIMIQQHIELDCPFGLPIGCPWKNFNAKLNQRCVETVKFLGKRKLMPWRNCMAVSPVAQLHGSVPEAYGKYRRTFSESDGHWRTTSWIWLERIPLQDDSTCLRRFSNLRKSLADYWPAPTGRRSSTQNVPNCQRTVFVFITEPPCGLGNRNILLRTSWLHFFHPFKSLLGQV